MPFQISDGGPASVLALAAPRLGRSVDEHALQDRFYQHESPQSLKALIEIAAEVGLRAKAFRAEPDSLGEIDLPAVVHLNEPNGEESGFALLVGRDDRHVRVAEGPQSLEYQLTADEFANWWSGVVVTLAPDESGSTVELRRAGPWLRLRRWLTSGDLTFSIGDAALRVFLPLLTLAALAWPLRLVVENGFSGLALGLAVCALLTAAGVIASRELYLASHRSHVPQAASRLAETFCKKGSRADCEGVLASQYAFVFGISFASLGLALLASNLVMFAVGFVLPAGYAAPLATWLAVAHLIAVPGSVWLIAVQFYPLRRFCLLCMVCHAAIVTGAILGAWWLLQAGAIASPAAVGSFAALHAVAFAGALGLGVTLVALAMEVRSHRARLGWIGATPWGAVAEMMGRPALDGPREPSPFHFGMPDTPLQMDALIHPVCAGCETVVISIESLVSRFPERISCSFFVPPRDLLSKADIELCTSFYLASRSFGGPRTVAYFKEVKKDPWKFLAQAEEDMPAMLERLFGRAPSIEHLDRAREDIAVASEFFDSTRRGTPVVLINGRPWESSLDDLVSLLERQPERLIDMIGTKR